MRSKANFRTQDETRRGVRGYLIVIFVIIVAFVGVIAAMQVLVLTSVATTSRAFDAYRQSVNELMRLERVVAEALQDQPQVTPGAPSASLADALATRLRSAAPEGTVATTVVPSTWAAPTAFPDLGGGPTVLVAVPASVQATFAAELCGLVGPRAAIGPELSFEFATTRTVLDSARTYRVQVTAQPIAVPLTRYALFPYDLPNEIGRSDLARGSGPAVGVPQGLVPGRDTAFLNELQAANGVLPYHYRRRAALATAYQYLFSQAYVDRAAEYAGITHYHQLDAVGPTATLAGLTKAGATASLDVALAGSGTYDAVSDTRDLLLLFSESSGSSLALSDSGGASNAGALMLLLVGPSDLSKAPLQVQLTTLTRPVVIIGYHVRVSAAAGTAIAGAIFLDPVSAIAPGPTFAVGHLSFWAGSNSIPTNAVTAAALPAAVESLAPRVTYVATRAARL